MNVLSLSFSGESYLDCCERILNTLVCIETHQDETYLIVAHQGLLRCVIGYLLRVEVNTKMLLFHRVVFVGCHFAHMRRLIHDPTRPILFLMTYHQSAKRSISHEIKNIDVSSQLLHERVELLSRLVQLLPEPNFFVLGRHLVTRSVTFNQSESFVMKPSLSLPGFSFSGCDVTGDFECRQPLKNKLKICFYTILKQQR